MAEQQLGEGIISPTYVMAVSWPFPMDGSVVVVGGKNQKRRKSENKISVRRVDGTAAIKAAGPNGIAISIPYVDQQQC
jgi:hypothetical protein